MLLEQTVIFDENILLLMLCKDERENAAIYVASSLRAGSGAVVPE
jgi:hypothetical protein